MNQENVIVQHLTIDNVGLSDNSNNFILNPSNIMRHVDIEAGSHSDSEFRRRLLNEKALKISCGPGPPNPVRGPVYN